MDLIPDGGNTPVKADNRYSLLLHSTLYFLNVLRTSRVHNCNTGGSSQGLISHFVGPRWFSVSFKTFVSVLNTWDIPHSRNYGKTGTSEGYWYHFVVNVVVFFFFFLLFCYCYCCCSFCMLLYLLLLLLLLLLLRHLILNLLLLLFLLHLLILFPFLLLLILLLFLLHLHTYRHLFLPISLDAIFLCSTIVPFASLL